MHLIVITTAICCVLLASTQPSTQPMHDDRYTVGPVIVDDPLTSLDHWKAQLEKPGTLSAREGVLSIDAPAGCSLWYNQPLDGPILITYTARMIKAGGANDRVSDLNCFWMASDPKNPDDIFAHPRSGKFADYNNLLTYYVGMGGNANTTTRFRRYIGDAANRPMLAEHDRVDPLLAGNVDYHIALVAAGKVIQFWCDGRKIFELIDDKPYTRGWFAFRTVASHIEIRDFAIRRLIVR